MLYFSSLFLSLILFVAFAVFRVYSVLMTDQKKREQAIVKDLLSSRTRTTAELQEILGVSRETLRKDLLHIEAQGLIIREFGKVRINEHCSAEALLEYGLLSKRQRLQLLEKEFGHGGEKRISTLAKEYQVTTETMRSDLRELEGNGVLIIRHGSVRGMIRQSGLPRELSLPQSVKDTGLQASLHIRANETIFLDGGPVCCFIASQIPRLTRITVVTNSLEILSILNSRDYAYPVHLVQGVLARERQTILSNDPEQISRLHISKAFISTLHYASRKFYCEYAEDAVTLHSIADSSQSIYLILSSTGLGRRGNSLFNYPAYQEKVRELLIDDEIPRERLRLEFPASYPLVVCGADYSIRIAKRERWRVGLLINKNRNQFVKAVHDGILQHAVSIPSLSIEVTECDNSYESVAEHLDRLISDGIDIVIDYSLCVESLYYVSEMCTIKNIPLISVDLSSSNSCFYGANNQTAGSIAGEHAYEYIKRVWDDSLDDIIIIGRYQKYPPYKIRISSTLESLKEHGIAAEGRVHTVDWVDDDPESRNSLITLLKERQSRKKLILFYNLRLLLSSYEYIQDWCSRENTIVVVQNYSYQLGELMEHPDSTILGCVDYDTAHYGSGIISCIRQIIDGNSAPVTTYTNLSWRENSNFQ